MSKVLEFVNLDSYDGVYVKYNNNSVYLCINKVVFTLPLVDAKKLKDDLDVLLEDFVLQDE